MLRLATAAMVAVATACMGSPAVAEFPEGNIQFVIPFGTGGGFDRTVRMIAPYMEKALPKKVEVLPKNVPGAGGAKGTAQVYRAKPDGMTIGIANFPGVALPAITGESVAYDHDKLTWIARIGTADYMMATGANSSIRTIDDLKKLGRPVKITVTGFGSTAYAAAQIIAEELKFSAQMLGGYKGSGEYVVAAVRGDGDATVAPVSVLKKFVQAGDARGIFTTEATSSVPGVPTIGSLGYKDLTGLGVDRYVVGPPGMPEAVVKALSDALMKSMADPEAAAMATKVGEPFEPLDYKAAKAAATKSLSLYLKHKPVLVRQNN